MTPSMIDPERVRAAGDMGANAPTVNALEPRERVRGVVANRLFGDLVVPARIDRFELIRELGAGGMGVVYAAHDPRLDRAVALKVLARTGEGPEASRRLLREAQAMARLRHPNVVSVHEVGTHGDQVFVAMELVDGGTLAEWLRGGPRPWRDVLALLLPAGRGLAAAHAAGLVHRDFKPANVLLAADGRALVSDFGLARAGAEPGPARPLDDAEATAELSGSILDAQLTRTGALLGTPAYMAPEQFRGEMATPRSDVFAFCVVVWEAIFGQRPFTGDTFATLVAAIDAGAITSPPRSIAVPAPLRRQLLRGLAANPADRHASMSELLDALAGAGSRTTRRGSLVYAALASLAFIGAGTALFSLSRPQEPAATAAQAVEGRSVDAVESSAVVLERWRSQGPRLAGSVSTMERADFTRVLGTSEAVNQHTRMMPSVRHGITQGLKLYGLRPDTPLKDLGFRNGDLLVALDDRPLTTLDSWEPALAAAAADGEVVILVKRKDDFSTLTIRIVDAGSQPTVAPR